MDWEGLCLLAGYGAVLAVLPVMGIIGWIRNRSR